MIKIGILGAGTWGMALSRMLANEGYEVTVWTRHGEKLDAYARTRIYPPLDNMAIPENVRFSKDIADACRWKDIIVIAVPSLYVRQVAAEASGYAARGQIVVSVAKGIEKDSLMMLTEVIASEIEGCRVVALSGPTHAEEVAKDLPASIVSASADMGAAEIVQYIFMNTCMRVYTNPDVKGVELCGALKNIMAIAAGISTGLGYGDNAKAALITRGLTEIGRLGLAMGCRVETFAGLAGVGDLIVTANSMNSRNYRAGILIGKGKSAAEARKEIGMVVEGINALPAALRLAEEYKVEMPIIFAVDGVINKGVNPGEAVMSLMMRGKKDEIGSRVG